MDNGSASSFTQTYSQDLSSPKSLWNSLKNDSNDTSLFNDTESSLIPPSFASSSSYVPDWIRFMVIFCGFLGGLSCICAFEMSRFINKRRRESVANMSELDRIRVETMIRYGRAVAVRMGDLEEQYGPSSSPMMLPSSSAVSGGIVVTAVRNNNTDDGGGYSDRISS